MGTRISRLSRKTYTILPAMELDPDAPLIELVVCYSDCSNANCQYVVEPDIARANLEALARVVIADVPTSPPAVTRCTGSDARMSKWTERSQSNAPPSATVPSREWKEENSITCSR